MTVETLKMKDCMDNRIIWHWKLSL